MSTECGPTSSSKMGFQLSGCADQGLLEGRLRALQPAVRVSRPGAHSHDLHISMPQECQPSIPKRLLRPVITEQRRKPTRHPSATACPFLEWRKASEAGEAES